MTAVGRRALLAAMASALAGRRATADARQAPRRNTLSLGMGAALTRPISVEQATTYLLMAALEAPFDAIRVGFANNTPNPYRIGGVCCCEADFWQPDSGAKWHYFSFGRTNGDGIVAGLDQPQACIVPGNAVAATGSVNVPRLFWSDWIDYRTASSTARPKLLFRTLVPPQQLPLAIPHGPAEVSRTVPDSGPRFINQAEIPGDYVTNLSIPAPARQVVPVCPIYVIQYRSINPGFQIIIGGDSHLSSWFTFADVAAFRMSQPDLPVAAWNLGWGGAPSNAFWPLLDAAIDAGSPSVVVIEGWTANDGMRPERDEAYLSRVRETANRTMQQGAIPIIVKGLPRALFGSPELGSWQQINQELDHLVPGAVVFDPEPIVQNPDRPGDWRPGFTVEGIHPNLPANMALAGPFESLLRSLGV